jgi:3-oxoadipate enol-lactonase
MTATNAIDRFQDFNDAALRFRDEGSGPAVILVHGWTLDLEMWDFQAAALQSSFRIIRFDRRGFGLSSGQPSVGKDCEDLNSVCRALAPGPVALVGMSQGARAVLRYAATAPEKVSCIVLDGPPGLAGTEGTDPEGLGHYRALARAAGMEVFRREWLKHPLVRLRTTDAATHQAVRCMIDRYPGRDLVASEVGLEPTPDAMELASINAPALIISGEHDATDRIEAANSLVQHLPRAQRATIPGAGHLPCLDNPATYNAILSAFLGKHSTAPI